MRVIGRDILESFCERHANARPWIAAWLHEMATAVWRTPQDIKLRYVSASFLAGNVVVLNMKGNRYRLEVHVAFRHGLVTVLWAGTHRDYDDRNRRR